MGAPHPGCRISRVRPKGKGLAEVVKLVPSDDAHRIDLLRHVREVLVSHGEDVNGFSFVVWGADGRSTCKSISGTAVSYFQLPDFVRNRLTAERTAEWSSDLTLIRLGYSLPDDSA